LGTEESSNVTFFATVSQERKAFLLWSCAMKRSMEKEIMQGTTSGQRGRGKARTHWQDNITKWTGLTGDSLLRSIKDRRQWRKIIHEAANPRIDDG